MTDEYWNAVCISLTQGKHTLIDSEDYDKIKAIPIHFVARYTRRGKQDVGYAMLSIGGESVRLHGYLMSCPAGALPDHKNRNSLDNRKENLRPSTKAQNTWNRTRGRAHRKSKYKGLWLDLQSKRWHAAIMAHGKRQRLGSFNSEENAALAYNLVAAVIHGEFAAFNIATIENLSGEV